MTGELLCHPHRVITVIEPQSLVVFGCTALHTMVGATAPHMIGKRGRLIYYLFIQNRGIFMIRTYNHTTLAGNSEVEIVSLDHSATGHFKYTQDQQSTVLANIQESHEKFCRDLNLQISHVQSAMLSTHLLTLGIYNVT